MYEYKFERVELTKWGFEQKPKSDYHQIVEINASRGWRLVQIFAPPIFANGNAAYFDLIFERQVQEELHG